MKSLKVTYILIKVRFNVLALALYAQSRTLVQISLNIAEHIRRYTPEGVFDSHFHFEHGITLHCVQSILNVLLQKKVQRRHHNFAPIRAESD